MKILFLFVLASFCLTAKCERDMLSSFQLTSGSSYALTTLTTAGIEENNNGCTSSLYVNKAIVNANWVDTTSSSGPYNCFATCCHHELCHSWTWYPAKQCILYRDHEPYSEIHPGTYSGAVRKSST